jgi:hypothetical protein
MRLTGSSASSGYIETPIEQVRVGIWSASWNGARKDLAHARQHVRRLGGRVRRIESGQDHDELVAAEAGENVRLAHRAGKPLRDRLQQRIAGVVTEGVVDALEVIEVEEQASDVIALCARLPDDFPELLVEQRAIGKPREDVVLREAVRLRGRDLQLLGALRDFFLERPLIARHLALRFGEPVRHVVEGAREQPELVGRARRHPHVEIAGPTAFDARMS